LRGLHVGYAARSIYSLRAACYPVGEGTLGKEGMLYDFAGVEPSLEELMEDPIFHVLRQYDGLPVDWPEWRAWLDESARRAA
jgi:hypothetical protein